MFPSPSTLRPIRIHSRHDSLMTAFRYVRITQKQPLLVSSIRLLLRPPACCHYATAERIFVKFYIGGGFTTICQEYPSLFKIGKIWLYDDLRTFMIRRRILVFRKELHKKSNTEQPDRQRWSNTLDRRRMYSAYQVARTNTVTVFTIPVNLLVPDPIK